MPRTADTVFAPADKLFRLRAVCERVVSGWKAGDASEALEGLEDVMDELFTPTPDVKTLGLIDD